MDRKPARSPWLAASANRLDQRELWQVRRKRGTGAGCLGQTTWPRKSSEILR